jgi:hypothetical protein
MHSRIPKEWCNGARRLRRTALFEAAARFSGDTSPPHFHENAAGGLLRPFDGETIGNATGLARPAARARRLRIGSAADPEPPSFQPTPGAQVSPKIWRYGCTGPADTHLAGQPDRRNTAAVLARAAASHFKGAGGAWRESAEHSADWHASPARRVGRQKESSIAVLRGGACVFRPRCRSATPTLWEAGSGNAERSYTPVQMTQCRSRHARNDASRRLLRPVARAWVESLRFSCGCPPAYR